MGIFWSEAERKKRLRGKSPMVLVPPLFDYPPIAARTRMSVPAYELMFGKVSLHNLFEDYFDQAGNLTSRIMLKPLEDPHVDLMATVSVAADKNGGTEVKGDALFRWQKDLDDPHTFMDVLVSTSKLMLQLRSCAYYPKYRIGAFGTLPLLVGNRVHSEDYGVVGVRYGSENLSFGASFVPFPASAEVPFGAWLVGRNGSLTAGVQYKPLSGNKNLMPFTDLKNWNYAISYGVGSASPLSPSFIFSLELARSTQLVASFYQHLVVQRGVKNPFEDDHIVGITNYIDFGLELATRIDKDKPTESANNSLFQLAASWQANKNFLLKGKLGPSKSSVALAFKSWWRPSFTFSVTAVNDHSKGTTSYGFGIRVEDLRQPRFCYLSLVIGLYFVRDFEWHNELQANPFYYTPSVFLYLTFKLQKPKHKPLFPSSPIAASSLPSPPLSSPVRELGAAPLPSMAGRHTIILMQPSQNRASRTFMDYNSINHALDGICGLYERKIRDINPMVPNITYDITDLYNFIDGLADISALVYDHSIQAFLPYDRQWIKQKLFQHLKKLAQR